MLESDREGKWAWIEAMRKRRSPKSGGSGERITTLKDALISLCNDADHAVRMHMASAITTLFFRDSTERSCDRHVTLLPRKEQEEVYEQILAMLDDAYKVMVSCHSDYITISYSLTNSTAPLHCLPPPHCLIPPRLVKTSLVLRMTVLIVLLVW